jgi:circadian clock protein KaiB
MDAHRLRLYVVGNTPASSRAIVNTRRFCEDHLPGAYDLDVVDISLDPAVATTAEVIAAPTLVKEAPPPVRRFIGDMSNTARLLAGFGLEPAPEGR